MTTIVYFEKTQPQYIFLNRQGLKGNTGNQGEKGDTGEITDLQNLRVITRAAAHSLNGHRVVFVNFDNEFQYADASVEATAYFGGVTTAAFAEGVEAQALILGEITDPSFSWSPGPIYMGLEGMLTQTAPETGVIYQIGTATGPTTLMINPIYIATLG